MDNMLDIAFGLRGEVSLARAEDLTTVARFSCRLWFSLVLVVIPVLAEALLDGAGLRNGCGLEHQSFACDLLEAIGAWEKCADEDCMLEMRTWVAVEL